MKSIQCYFAAAIIVATLIPVTASAHAGGSRSGAPLGQSANTGAAMRIVDLSTGSQSVNVKQGDIITFTAAGKSFTWQFDTLRPDTNFKLADIAPKDFDTRNVMVYVAPHPLYRN